MTDKMTPKRHYEAPRLTVVSFKTEQGYVLSLVGAFNLGFFYTDCGNDAWSGSASSVGQFSGGWVDEGRSAWD